MAALAGASDFLSAQELHQVLRERGETVGLSTVYRTLQGLAASDQVDSIVGDDGEAWYRRCEAAHHHHHLVCRVCGRTVEVANDRVERWADEVAADHGFSDVSHTLEVFGVCPGCASEGVDQS
jgi:Fur family ferric uptake transcriptional regulator